MTLIEELESIFSEFHVSLNEARIKLKPIAEYAYNLEGLLHHLYFAMASLVTKDVKSVLELGTGLGETTIVLSRLFPTATIYTLDLPENDISCSVQAWRKIEKKKNAMERFNRDTNEDNITFIAKNSFFVSSLGLPKEFEMIWIDGGHTFPAVAWDIMYSYNHLKKGGFMFMHDYSIKPCNSSQVKETLNYISSRIKENILILPCVGDDDSKTACIRKE